MIQLPEEIKFIEEEKNRLVFSVEPLYPGYGVTLGNAMRRVLLSSIDGAAITTVKIRNVNHEFSSIPGVLEDVIEIVMNIKKIRLKLFSDQPVTMMLKVSGAKEITAKQIKASSEVEIVNPEQHIATITDSKVELDMEITAEKGIGYVPVEQRQKEKISVGTIAVDAIFSPVKNVNTLIESVIILNKQGENLVLNVGYSHPVKIIAPKGITFKVEKTLITVEGIDPIKTPKEVLDALRGKVVILDPESSEIAKKLEIKERGVFGARFR